MNLPGLTRYVHLKPMGDHHGNGIGNPAKYADIHAVFPGQDRLPCIDPQPAGTVNSGLLNRFAMDRK